MTVALPALARDLHASSAGLQWVMDAYALGLAVLLLVAAVALTGFVAVERRRARPMLDLGLFHRPAFVAIMLAATLLSAGAFAYLPHTSLWLHSVLEHGAVQAGLTILPLSLAALVVSAGVGRVLHDRSPRWPVGGGLGLIGAGALLQALVGADSSATVLLPGLLVAGVGVGLAVPSAAARALGGGQARTLLAQPPTGQRATIDHLVHQAVASGLSQVCLAAAAMGCSPVCWWWSCCAARPPSHRHSHPADDTPPARPAIT